MTLNQISGAEHPDLAESLRVIEYEVRRHWEDSNNLWWFTDHGPGHSERVVALARDMAALVSRESPPLNAVEEYLLLAACWVHDIGMQSADGPTTTESANRIRSGHAAESQRLIGRRSFPIGIENGAIVDLIARIAGVHSTSRYVDGVSNLALKRNIRAVDVRPRLIAAMVLFADELDLRNDRLPRLRRGQAIDPESQSHWLKHECVSSVGLRRSPSNGEIEIHLEMLRGPNLKEDDEVAIERWIVGKLQQQLVLVESEFQANGLHFSSRPVIDWEDCEPDLLHYSDAAMDHVRNEVARLNLINHDECLSAASQAIANGESVRITGPLDESHRDIAGREDVFQAVVSRARAAGLKVVEPPAPEVGIDPRTTGDLLGALVTAIGLPLPAEPDPDDDERSVRVANEEVLERWLDSGSDPDVIAISSIDTLSDVARKETLAWLAHASSRGKRVLVTEAASVDDVTSKWTIVTVGATPLAESRRFIARFYGKDHAHSLVDESVTYADVKSFYGRWLGQKMRAAG